MSTFAFWEPAGLLTKYITSVPVCSSSKTVGPESKPTVLMDVRGTGACHPRSSWVCWRHETYRSKSPFPPGRLLARYNQCPSDDSIAARSLKAEFTVSGRNGASQGASVLARWAIQM